MSPPAEGSRLEPCVEVYRKSCADATIYKEKQGNKKIKDREYPRQHLRNFQHIIISFLFQRKKKTIFNMNHQGGGGTGGKGHVSGETEARSGSDG